MAVNIVAVVLLAACVVLAVRAIIKKHQEAKLTGNPGCIGCSACCGKHNACSTMQHQVPDK